MKINQYNLTLFCNTNAIIVRYSTYLKKTGYGVVISRVGFNGCAVNKATGYFIKLLGFVGAHSESMEHAKSI